MAHTFTKLLTHMIFSTKDRLPQIDAEFKPELFAYMSAIVKAHGGKVLTINGPADHVHLLASLPPTIAVAEILRLTKTNSSKWVHEKWPQRSAFAWQTGYGAFSVSRSNQDVVFKYIGDQENHHQKISFKKEFVAFLKSHDIEYDERYIWE